MYDMKAAVTKLFEKRGAGFCFPSDLLWKYLDGPQPPGPKKPALIKALDRDKYIVATTRTTRAVSGARKGSPTKEYTFGAAISPDSLGKALATEAAQHSFDEADIAAPDLDFLSIPENSNGEYPLPFPLQVIVHGCPGSGKSYQLAEQAKKSHYVFRTVFHPESSYSDFVGGLRPQSIYRIEAEKAEYVGSTLDVPGEPLVQYVVQPGAFLKAYQIACLYPTKSVVLIIEELSRGVAAHIFGDTLQLLDRAEEGPISGYSEYEIEARPDIKSWLLLNEIWNDAVAPGNLRLPPNLYIWATMNRADQNARQLDSAFLRRWDKIYLSYLQKGSYDNETTMYGGIEVAWGTLRSSVNAGLKQMQGISEDKFVGPYMIPKRRLKDPNAMYEDLWGYLWNDVLKNRASTYFEGVTTFAELGQIWGAGQGKPIGELIIP
jgi:GTPase subunit of restriction endonuclease